ncbi:PREDICTED: facilitated trehalose transporter Tret1-like [Papilio xuthus]|uniref:Facilitated trehalose transporter Tret1-like n=1 Tax=Papilio xuthus TaxID=66420 RepID=A0AAJ6YYJ3_PAPXU|nr:PREDICTED: facilitated trehalose transporter Tret1-like [Papilio xuthus]
MKKFHTLLPEGSKFNQILCAILINFPVFVYGASIGWMSPMTLLLQSKDSPKGVPLTESEVSWMAAAAYLVCIPADVLLAYAGDKLGRKLLILFISGVSAASWILLLVSIETWALVLSRALVGITMAGSYVTCPIYTKEISENHIRGTLGCLVILFHTTGNLFLYVIGDILSYRTILWVCLALPAFHIVLFMVMPESPSYLVKKGNDEEAVRVLAWLRCRRVDDVKIQEELDVIKIEQKNDEESSKFLLKAIFKDKILFRAFRIALVATLAREVCGAIPVLNFAGEIFTWASEGKALILTPNQQAMLLGLVQVLGSALASSIVDRIGRRTLLTSTALISGLSMCSLASWFVAKHYGAYTPAWLPIVTLCLCIFCDSAGLQPVSVVLTGEIFSFKYRASVMGMTMGLASFADFIQMLFFKPLANSIGIHVAFYFFGGICLVTALYVTLAVPETKNRSLTEIYEDLRPKSDKDSIKSKYDEDKYVGSFRSINIT